MSTLSIVMPVLNEAAIIEAVLTALLPFRQRGVEVIVVDGDSEDRTAELARPHVDRVLTAPRGRATQMNAGAAAARGDVLLFLHADTRLPAGADRFIIDGLLRSGRCWGRFDVRLDGDGVLGLVSFMMNARSRLTCVATGDQALFVTRVAFERAGGFPPIPLMEDVTLSIKLKRICHPLCLGAHVITSARRWRKHGVLRTIVLMWTLRIGFFLGADPAKLARQYGYACHER